FWLMAALPSLAACVFAVGWLNLVKAGYSGVLPSLLTEQFPVETRAVGVSLAFSISVTIFGGFAPFFATWLIAVTGDKLSPSYYLMAKAALSIIALMAIERRGRRAWPMRRDAARTKQFSVSLRCSAEGRASKSLPR